MIRSITGLITALLMMLAAHSAAPVMANGTGEVYATWYAGELAESPLINFEDHSSSTKGSATVGKWTAFLAPAAAYLGLSAYMRESRHGEDPRGNPMADWSAAAGGTIAGAVAAWLLFAGIGGGFGYNSTGQGNSCFMSLFILGGLAGGGIAGYMHRETVAENRFLYYGTSGLVAALLGATVCAGYVFLW
ncbi:MAG: hypothetical protein KBA61_04485 [Spirochaetes bacterium]|nr:hypothetical protein [Spirochaetota bacterium]